MDQDNEGKDFGNGFFVPADGDRRREQRRVLGNLRIDYKVLGHDTNGELFVIENVSDGRGGPPRHVHHAQDEWFYAIVGEFTVEVGGERYDLHPGDSIFAPRNVPHVWAHLGDSVGRLLIAFQPAGAMEPFFDEMAKMTGPPTAEQMRQLFQDHGMAIVGPPL